MKTAAKMNSSLFAVKTNRMTETSRKVTGWAAQSEDTAAAPLCNQTLQKQKLRCFYYRLRRQRQALQVWWTLNYNRMIMTHLRRASEQTNQSWKWLKKTLSVSHRKQGRTGGAVSNRLMSGQSHHSNWGKKVHELNSVMWCRQTLTDLSTPLKQESVLITSSS